MASVDLWVCWLPSLFSTSRADWLLLGYLPWCIKLSLKPPLVYLLMILLVGTSHSISRDGSCVPPCLQRQSISGGFFPHSSTGWDRLTGVLWRGAHFHPSCLGSILSPGSVRIAPFLWVPSPCLSITISEFLMWTQWHKESKSRSRFQRWTKPDMKVLRIDLFGYNYCNREETPTGAELSFTEMKDRRLYRMGMLGKGTLGEGGWSMGLSPAFASGQLCRGETSFSYLYDRRQGCKLKQALHWTQALIFPQEGGARATIISLTHLHSQNTSLRSLKT